MFWNNNDEVLLNGSMKEKKKVRPSLQEYVIAADSSVIIDSCVRIAH
jgi:hypothetical protein